jgi:4-hydroxy-tetrahydrodipicolinate synthase
MKNTIFTGAGVAIATPMHADGSINYNKLGELIDFNIDNGTDAIIICGTTGESSTMTDEEHIECIRYAVEKVNHRIPVIAGTGSNHTDYAIHFLRKLRLSVQTLFFWSHLITTRPLREDLSNITQISLTQ